MSVSPLWTPTPERAAASQLAHFAQWLQQTHGIETDGYAQLHQWSVDHYPTFWSLWFDYAQLVHAAKGAEIESPQCGLSAQAPARFFPDTSLSFTANLLRRRDHAIAIRAYTEAGLTHSLSYAELYTQVAKAAAYLQENGVRQGDRVAAIISNCPEAIVFCLATIALGACWTSCSPDFGAEAILDRLTQVSPKALIATVRYQYNGKTCDIRDRIAAVIPSLTSLVAVVTLGTDKAFATTDSYDDVMARAPLDEAALCQRRPFNTPAYILYSSGTTGKPKCIVHGAGGLLLQHLKEHRLHLDIRKDDRVFFYTSCGWMMWNWLIAALASQASLILYDGSPFAPGPEWLWEVCRDATFFGTSAKYLDHLAKLGFAPKDSQPLASLKTIAVTGSPLSPERFAWTYHHIKADMHLASISGGTDICSCFLLGAPTEPVYAGELQVAGLGLDVVIADTHGRRIDSGVGELTVTNPFPAMPRQFWGDPHNTLYHQAYFDKFPKVWAHGDFVQKTDTGYMILGRSDATLNPGGVRIGTNEIYRRLDAFAEISDALAVGVQCADDVKIVLFVVLRDGAQLTPERITQIQQHLKTTASPRHVPATIIAVSQVPYTRSGKLAEMLVRNLIHGREITNKDAIANPECLSQFQNLPQILELNVRSQGGDS